MSLYWFTGTAGSSANLYYEMGHDPSAWVPKTKTTVPLGVALVKSTDITIRRYAERDAPVVHWTELERGGNCLPLEQSVAFAAYVKTFFAAVAGR
ncbi:hypothetical protein OG948_33455 [Embleya sp. NBC_00888]|uniref:hypothetical protein n=1 Tax=Embleya sp. NBC_00888 TaxID=2975960 RepID=UPI003863129A|nr:hypothetical protein OG948_33455 [Embleya sp. NBC_00888]